MIVMIIAFSTIGKASDGHFTSFVRIFPEQSLNQWRYSMTLFKDGIPVYKETKMPLLDFFDRVSPSEHVIRERRCYADISTLSMSNEKDFLNIRCAVLCIIRYAFQGVLVTNEFLNHPWFPQCVYSSPEERACELVIGQDDIKLDGLLDSQFPINWLDVFKDLIAKYADCD